MNDVQEMIKHIDYLYRIAYTKTNDSHDADDLVQETCLNTLKAINNGAVIHNMKAYLLRVLNNTFYHLANKISKYYTMDNNNIYEMIDLTHSHTDTEECSIDKTEEAKAIRREISHLCKIYREVMVQFYMESKDILTISKNLNISEGTVKSRLSAGRKLMKERLSDNESYSSKSYSPHKLLMNFFGTFGLNGEPYNVINSALDQNVLITAYQKPLTMDELTDFLGVATFYIEESVDKLVRHEFMKRVKNKVYTNFLIIDDKIVEEKHKVQKQYVDETFDEAIKIFNDLVKEYKTLKVFDKFNDVQIYIYAFGSVFHLVRIYIKEALKLIKFQDYPDRLDGGKWLIYSGYNTQKNESDVLLPYSYRVDDFTAVQSEELSIEVWKTHFGKITYNNNFQTIAEKAKILYNLYMGYDLSIKQMQYIPELMKFGLIVNDHENKKIANIPIITASDYSKLLELKQAYAKKYMDCLGEKLIDMIKQNIISYPEHIKPVSCGTHMVNADRLIHLSILKTAEEKIIKINEKTNYPLCMIIKKNYSATHMFN